MPRKRPEKPKKLSKRKLCPCMRKQKNYLSSKEKLGGTVSFLENIETNTVVKSEEEDLYKLENIKLESSYDSFCAMVENQIQFFCDEDEKSKILEKCQVTEQVNSQNVILSLQPISNTVIKSMSENMNNKYCVKTKNKHKNIEVEKNIKQENVFYENIPRVVLRRLSEADIRKWRATQKLTCQKQQESRKSVTNITENSMTPKQFEQKQVIITKQVKLSNALKENNKAGASKKHPVRKLLKRDYNYRTIQGKSFRKRCFQIKSELVTFRAKSSDPIFKSCKLTPGMQVELYDQSKTNEVNKILPLGANPMKYPSKDLRKRLGSPACNSETQLSSRLNHANITSITDIQQNNNETVNKDNTKSVESSLSQINKESQPYKQPISMSSWNESSRTYRVKYSKPIFKECTVTGKKQESHKPQENKKEKDTLVNTNRAEALQNQITQLSSSQSKPAESSVTHVFVSPATIKRPPSRPKHKLKKSFGPLPLSCSSIISQMTNEDKSDTDKNWRENDCLSLYAESLSESLCNNITTKNYEEPSMCDYMSKENVEYGGIDINSWIENNPVGGTLSPEQSNINEKNSNPVQGDANNYDKNESLNLRDMNEHTDSRAVHIQKTETMKMDSKNGNCKKITEVKTSTSRKRWELSRTDLTCNLFHNVCPQLKMQNKCTLPKCRYTHTWPCDWKNKMLKMQKDDVMRIYNSAKAGNEMHLLKMILTVVLKQLAIEKDLNNIFLLTQDIITKDLNSDRQPYIKTVIEHMCECGFEYYMVVDLLFTCTSLEKNRKELLADILLTLVVENGQLYNNWSAVRKLCKYKQYDLDNGVLQSILRQTFETSDLDERLCRAVYDDVIKPLGDVKPIPTKILLLCVLGLEKIGLKSESQSLNTKVQNFQSKRSTPKKDFVANNCSQLESVYRNSTTYFRPSLNESRQSGLSSPGSSRMPVSDQQTPCGAQVSAHAISSKVRLSASTVSQVPAKIPRVSESEIRVSIGGSHESANASEVVAVEPIFIPPVGRIPGSKSRDSTTRPQQPNHGSLVAVLGSRMSTAEHQFSPSFWKESDLTSSPQGHAHGSQASGSSPRMSTGEHLFPPPVRRIPDSKSGVPTTDPQQSAHGPRVPVSAPRMYTADSLYPLPFRQIPDLKSTVRTTGPQQSTNGPRVPVSGPRMSTGEHVFPPSVRRIPDAKSGVSATDPQQSTHGPRIPVSGPRMSTTEHLFPPPVRRIFNSKSEVPTTGAKQPTHGPRVPVSGPRMRTLDPLFPPPVRRIPASMPTLPTTEPQEFADGSRISTGEHLFPPPVRRISGSMSAVPTTGPEEHAHGSQASASGPRMSTGEHLFPPLVRRIPASMSAVPSTGPEEHAHGSQASVSSPRMSTGEHLFPLPVRRIPASKSAVPTTSPQELAHGPRVPVSGPRMRTADPLFPPPFLRVPVSGPSESSSALHEFELEQRDSSPGTSTPNSVLSEHLDESVIDNEINISDEQTKHEENPILKTDIQRAVFSSDLTTILSYVERYQIPDPLVSSCLEALREILFAIPQFYQNLYTKASDIKQNNDNMQTFLKTLGVNLVLLLWRSSDWNSAFEVLKDLHTHFLYNFKDVKPLLPDSSSIFKTSIVFCDIYLKKMYIQNAWSVLKENILDSKNFDGCNPADLKYAEAVLKLFMEKLCTPTWSYYGIQVVSHFIQHDFKIIDVRQYIDKIFTISVNENCPMSNIRNFMRISNWYNHISELSFRALVVHARKNAEKLLYFNLLETGMDLTIYPKIFGNEDVFEISVQYVFEEVVVLLEYLFVNMVRYMPRQNILLIKVRDRIDRVYDFNEPTANCLRIQQDLPPKQMLARVVNILQNTFQMDVTYHDQNNSVCIEREQLMLHLLRLQTSLLP